MAPNDKDEKDTSAPAPSPAGPSPEDKMRRRKRLSASNATATVLLTIGAVAALNLIATRVFGRLDLTQNKVYTLSQGSKDVVAALPVYDRTAGKGIRCVGFQQQTAAVADQPAAIRITIIDERECTVLPGLDARASAREGEIRFEL